MKRTTFLLLLLWLTTSLGAQRQLYTDDFLAELDAMDVELGVPVESDFKQIKVLSSVIQSYGYAVRSRKAKLEMRYYVEPHKEGDLTFQVPQVRFTRYLMNLATNDEEAVMAVHDLEASDLSENFQADWGKVAFFQPKLGFSNRQHAKLLCLYREGSGMAYVLFLFDEPSEALEHRFYDLRFKAQ